MRIVVLRHPKVLDPGLCYGRLDVPIASLDETIAHLEGSRAKFRELGLFAKEVVLRSSPRTRCLEVARWFSNELGTSPSIHDDIAELDLGGFEGRSFLALEKEPEFSAFMNDWERAQAPGGESVPLFQARVEKFLESLERSPRTELWIAHAGIIRALRVILRGETWPMVMRDNIPHLEPVLFDL